MGRQRKNSQETKVGRFLGSFRHRLDEKGRLVLPSSIRARVGSRVVLSGGFDGCIAGHPPEDFHAFVENEIEKKGGLVPDVRKLSRYFHGTAAEVDVDRQGRLLIPAGLRDIAKLHIEGGEVVVVGAGKRFEIWAAAAWDACLAEAQATLEDAATSLSREARVG